MNILRKFVDPSRGNSIAIKTRRRNFELFKAFIHSLPKPLKILDIGGTQLYWERMDFIREDSAEIILLNLSKEEVSFSNFKSIVGDARDLSRFEDNEFDVVFSHSVIEHVGDLKDQCKMADEIKRVGKRYFIQTPNRFFPIEQHFLVPLFQFFPFWFKLWIISYFDIGWCGRIKDRQKAIEILKSVRLLTERELRKIFPGAIIYKEKFMGLTKSFLIYESSKDLS